MSGPCDIGDNADLVPYFWVRQYVGENTTEHLAAVSEDMNNVCRVTNAVIYFSICLSIIISFSLVYTNLF